MSKVNLGMEALKKWHPQCANLFALGNRVCRHEGNANRRALNVFGSLAIPRGDIIKESRAGGLTPNKFHVDALFTGHEVLPNERWIAEDEGALVRWDDLSPVETERVADLDIGSARRKRRSTPISRTCPPQSKLTIFDGALSRALWASGGRECRASPAPRLPCRRNRPRSTGGKSADRESRGRV